MLRKTLQRAFALAALCLAGCAFDPSDSGEPARTDDAPLAQVTPAAADAAGALASPGCAKTPTHRAGSAYLTLAVPDGGGQRRMLVSLPPNFDPKRTHRVIFGLAGRDWTGQQMVSYFNFEPSRRQDEIIVYPDPLRRTFGSWGSAIGWQLGPYGGNAVGMQDINFMRAAVKFMTDNYCVEPTRVFATGHSWGGDFAQVLSCFTDLFRATVPVAANDPYWFRGPSGPVQCAGKTAVWTMYGLQDNSFNDAGANGRKVRDFWLTANQCAGAAQATDLNITLPSGKKEQCVKYEGCKLDTRLCLYDGQFKHQIPRAYFVPQVLGYFRSF